jgi:drug/metabolite transporter (DMT)-like permease
MPQNGRIPAMAFAALVLGGGLFAASSFLVAYSRLGPDAVGFWRMALALAPLTIWIAVRPPKKRVPARWALIALAGAFLAVDLILWHRSIHWIGPGFAAILTNFMVFFLALFGILLFRERFTWQFGLVLAIAFAGAVLIISPEAEMRDDGLAGGIFGILSGLAYAMSLVVMKFIEKERISGALEPEDIRCEMLFFCLGAMMTMLLAAIVSGQSLAIPDLRELGLMVGYGICVQFLGWLLIVHGTKQVDVTLVGLILLLEPVLALLLNGVLGFGVPSVMQFAAAVAVLVAVAWGTLLKARTNSAA